MFATTGEHSVGADIVGLRVVSTRLGLASLVRAGSTSSSSGTGSTSRSGADTTSRSGVG